MLLQTNILETMTMVKALPKNQSNSDIRLIFIQGIYSTLPKSSKRFYQRFNQYIRVFFLEYYGRADFKD